MAMTLQTDKGKTYNVINASIGGDGAFSVLMYDNRKLYEIAADFDGVQTFTFDDPDRDLHTVYMGYTNVFAVLNILDNMVQITLHKGVDA